MKERPILFSAPMVRAILNGTKTQTRRVVKPRHIPSMSAESLEAGLCSSPNLAAAFCPYGQPGDQLYVRETWAEADMHDGIPVVTYRAGGCIPVGRRDQNGPDYLIHGWAMPDTPDPDKWHPSIHMPRWASRILLEITAVRVERLNDIGETDAIAEGIHHDDSILFNGPWFASATDSQGCGEPAHAYANLWEQINGPGSWDANPWVWVVEFKRIKP